MRRRRSSSPALRVRRVARGQRPCRSGHVGGRTDLAPALPEPVLAGLDAASVTYVSGDLRTCETLDALVEARGQADVVHVAAYAPLRRDGRARSAQGAPTPRQALEVFEVNAIGDWQLCSAFTAAGTLGRFVYISTRSVFGRLRDRAADHR